MDRINHLKNKIGELKLEGFGITEVKCIANERHKLIRTPFLENNERAILFHELKDVYLLPTLLNPITCIKCLRRMSINVETKINFCRYCGYTKPIDKFKK